MPFDCKLFFLTAPEFTVMWAPLAYCIIRMVLTLHLHCEGVAHITTVDYNTNQRVLTFNPVT